MAKRLAGRAKCVLRLAVDIATRPRDVQAFLRYCKPGGTSCTIDAEEFDYLVELTTSVSDKFGALVEFGALFGFSAQALALGMRSDQHLITVDRFSWNPVGIPSWRHKELALSNLAF